LNEKKIQTKLNKWIYSENREISSENKYSLNSFVSASIIIKAEIKLE